MLSIYSFHLSHTSELNRLIFPKIIECHKNFLGTHIIVVVHKSYRVGYISQYWVELFSRFLVGFIQMWILCGQECWKAGGMVSTMHRIWADQQIKKSFWFPIQAHLFKTTWSIINSTRTYDPFWRLPFLSQSVNK